MQTVCEDGEGERKVRNSVDSDGPQSQEDAITGRLQGTSQRATVQLAPTVQRRQSFVDLQECLVARQRSRHLELRPTNVNLNRATVALIRRVTTNAVTHDNLTFRQICQPSILSYIICYYMVVLLVLAM